MSSGLAKTLSGCEAIARSSAYSFLASATSSSPTVTRRAARWMLRGPRTTISSVGEMIGEIGKALVVVGVGHLLAGLARPQVLDLNLLQLRQNESEPSRRHLAAVGEDHEGERLGASQAVLSAGRPPPAVEEVTPEGLVELPRRSGVGARL